MPARPPRVGALPRIARSADFVRVLRMRSRAVTAHFAMHHLAAAPLLRGTPPPAACPDKLSTGEVETSERPVDDSPLSGLPGGGPWVGAVVPKRHARRAVTRSLLKRQIYAAAERHRDRLAPGLWIVRLRAPFDRTRFASAASPALRHDAHAELESLLAAAITTTPR